MAPTIIRTILLCTTLLVAACAPTVEDAADGPRGAVGKADHVTGTCAGSCGGASSGSCWCDDLCASYGDCCDDAGELCGVDECTAAGTGCHEGDVCVDGAPNLCTAPATCSPQDAAGFGLCEMLLGYAWNGLECVSLSGCSCDGADCDALALDKAGCEAAHAHCLPGEGCRDPNDEGVEYKMYDPDTCAVIRFQCPDGWRPFFGECGCGCEVIPPKTCGGLLAEDCDEGEFCDYGAHCGAGDQTGVCREMPDFCTADYIGVCGCDGHTYATTCTAHASGVSVEHLGECEPPQDSCEGHCGGSSADGSCWCDAWCSYYGDCCDDETAMCG